MAAKKVELDPKTRPAESVALTAALIASLNEWFASHWASGTKLMLVGLAPYIVTWFLEKIGRYRPPVKGEVDLR
jgi:hypothetical protein